jgi:hypothetical protein
MGAMKRVTWTIIVLVSMQAYAAAIRSVQRQQSPRLGPSQIEIASSEMQVKVALAQAMTSHHWLMAADEQLQAYFYKESRSAQGLSLAISAALRGAPVSAPLVTCYYMLEPREQQTVLRFRLELSYRDQDGKAVRKPASVLDYSPEIFEIVENVKLQLERAQRASHQQ